MTFLEPVRSNSSMLPLDSWINWTTLYDICDHSPEFALELLHIFVKDMRLHLASLETAIATQSVAQIQREAHHIKGSSSNLGLVLIQTAAADLERFSPPTLFLNAPIVLMQLHQALKSIQAYLEQQPLPGAVEVQSPPRGGLGPSAAASFPLR
jgi:HPt (histidine-containing phosphotransfer) domain-containing protein